jgi:hypothetical protein
LVDGFQCNAGYFPVDATSQGMNPTQCVGMWPTTDPGPGPLPGCTVRYSARQSGVHATGPHRMRHMRQRRVCERRLPAERCQCQHDMHKCVALAACTVRGNVGHEAHPCNIAPQRAPLSTTPRRCRAPPAATAWPRPALRTTRWPATASAHVCLSACARLVYDPHADMAPTLSCTQRCRATSRWGSSSSWATAPSSAWGPRAQCGARQITTPPSQPRQSRARQTRQKSSQTRCAKVFIAHTLAVTVSGHHCFIMTCSWPCSMHANRQRHGPGILHQRQRHARGGKGIYDMQRRLLPCARAHERRLPRHVHRTPSLLHR